MKVIFATSMLADGPMGRNVALTDEAVRNRRAFIREHFGVQSLESVTVQNVHGNRIVSVSQTDAGRVFEEGDGLITKEPNIPILVTHQDCVPIVLWNEPTTFVAVLHAGWRGVRAGILKNGLELAFKESLVSSLRIFVGPAIQACHFEVQEDVAYEFRKIAVESVIGRDGKLFIDLHKALASQAEGLGVAASHIIFDQHCTFHDKNFASWRRDQNREANMITVAMLRDESGAFFPWL